jgi:hypothetical protein
MVFKLCEFNIVLMMAPTYQESRYFVRLRRNYAQTGLSAGNYQKHEA